MANKEQRSERKYVESTKATLPPQTKYKTPDGKESQVRVESKHVEYIRSQPSSKYTPEVRRTTTINHIHEHRYRHPYDYYYHQPTVYVGGGYSSAFWWMMMEWSAERRALWLYHNQRNIERSAYERGMQDAAVAQEMVKLRTQNLSANPDYVDSEFRSDPSLMYDDAYIEAAYNPTPAPAPAPTLVQKQTHSGGSHAYTLVVWLMIILVAGALIWLFFFKRWGN